MILEMLRWWYATGWIEALHRITGWTFRVEQAFSLSILVRTLFSPWKRIIAITGRGLDARLHAALDNLVSRCVGFVVRSFAILAALIAMSGALLASTAIAIIWPFMPLLIIYFAVRGIIG